MPRDARLGSIARQSSRFISCCDLCRGKVSPRFAGREQRLRRDRVLTMFNIVSSGPRVSHYFFFLLLCFSWWGLADEARGLVASGFLFSPHVLICFFSPLRRCCSEFLRMSASRHFCCVVLTCVHGALGLGDSSAANPGADCCWARSSFLQSQLRDAMLTRFNKRIWFLLAAGTAATRFGHQLGIHDRWVVPLSKLLERALQQHILQHHELPHGACLSQPPSLLASLSCQPLVKPLQPNEIASVSRL